MENERFLDIKLSLSFLSAYAEYLTFLSSMNGGRDFVVRLQFGLENRKAPPLIWCEELKRETLEKAVLMEMMQETGEESDAKADTRESSESTHAKGVSLDKWPGDGL